MITNGKGEGKAPEFKVILVGDSGVGKTCIVVRASKDYFQETAPSTIGFSFLKLNKNIEGQPIELLIWDTAGQERYKSIIQMYYRGAKAAIVVFDLTNKVRNWMWN